MMKKILFFSRDPGGTNVLIPLILKLEAEYELSIWGKDGAINRYQMQGILCNDIAEYYGSNIKPNNIKDFLQREKPSLVITGTSADDYTEKYLWEEAEKLGIFSFAVLDQWMNYGIRFSPYTLGESDKFNGNRTISYLPSKVLVMDELSREKLIEEGVPEKNIAITGQPYLEFFSSMIRNISEDDIKKYKRQMKILENEKIIVYASEDISKMFCDTEEKYYWGYNEKTTFKQIKNVLNIEKEIAENTKVIIRPHPKEDIDYWKRFIENDKSGKYVLDEKSSSKLLIAVADLIIGMQSMFLLESALSEKPILSVQIGLCRENPLILDEMGVVNTILTSEELRNTLRKHLTGKSFHRQWKVRLDGIENICRLVKESI